MCQQFTISLSVKLQSQPHENNPETLAQLGVTVHYSPSFDSITKNYYS